MPVLNLQRKLLIFFLLLSIIPIVIVGYVQLGITEDELISSVNDRLSFVSTDIAKEIDRQYEQNWSRPAFFMREILQSDVIDASGKITSLKEISNFKGFISVQLSVEGVKNPILILQNNYKKRHNLSDQQAITLFQSSYSNLEEKVRNHTLYVSDPVYLAETQDWIITLATPLSKPVQGKKAILSLKLSARNILTLIRTHPFNQTGKIEIIDKEGNVLFDQNNTSRADQSFIREILEILKTGTRAIGVTPYIQYDREMLGAYAIPSYLDWVVTVSRDKELAYLPVTKIVKDLLFWASIGILLAMVGAQYFASIISKPVVAIDNVAKQVRDGNFDVQVPQNNSNDEIGHLSRRFNEMIQGLKERERVTSIFGRYQSKEVVEQLLNSSEALGLGGERKLITLLMTDLRGFTAMSEQHPPEEVIALLNDYFEVMIDIVEKYHGTINEIIGDALFVFFGAPVEMNDHAAQAIACALEMQQAMTQVNEMNQKNNRPSLEMGIGINSGEVVIGNIGSSKRTKYGVVGSDVNLTGRIESYTVGGQVLISESTYKLCHSKLQIKEEIRVQPKGVKHEMSIYDITAIGSPFNLQLESKKHNRTSLTTPVPVYFRKLDGKHVSNDTFEGQITELDLETALFTTDTQLEVLNNLSINLADKSLNDLDIYAKVTALQQNAYEIRFTSIPDKVKDFFVTVINC